MREFRRSEIEGTDQSFDEWMDSFETLLHGFYSPQIYDYGKNLKDHLKFLKDFMKLRDRNKRVVENFYQFKYENFFEEILKEIIDWQPREIKKGGSHHLHYKVALSLLDGIFISKKETGSYERFKKYYEEGLENAFWMKERSFFLKDKDTYFDVNKKYEIEDLFFYYFPTVNNVLDTNMWIERVKRVLHSAVKESSIPQDVYEKKYHLNDAVIKMLNAYDSDYFYSILLKVLEMSVALEEEISKEKNSKNEKTL